MVSAAFAVLTTIVAVDSTSLSVALSVIANRLHGSTLKTFWAGTSFLLASIMFVVVFQSEMTMNLCASTLFAAHAGELARDAATMVQVYPGHGGKRAEAGAAVGVHVIAANDIHHLGRAFLRRVLAGVLGQGPGYGPASGRTAGI